MRIQMVTTAAGPEQVLDAGKIYTVPAKLGNSLVDGGFALSLTSTSKRQPKPKPKKADSEED